MSLLTTWGQGLGVDNGRNQVCQGESKRIEKVSSVKRKKRRERISYWGSEDALKGPKDFK